MKKITSALFIMIFMFSASTFSQNQPEKLTKVKIHTDFGDMVAVLYNVTPQHRDNFIKNTNAGWYNGSIFHRVIKTFMIQGGRGTNGKEDPGYTVPAEIIDTLYHKRGSLCAARTADQVNPKRNSSGSQFYIVQGRPFTDAELDQIQQYNGRKYTAAQRETYKKQGGSPHLDGAYTVFGEVIEGFDVIDKIANVTVDKGNKPLQDVKMTISIIK